MRRARAFILFAAEDKDISAKIDDRCLYLVIKRIFFVFHPQRSPSQLRPGPSAMPAFSEILSRVVCVEHDLTPIDKGFCGQYSSRRHFFAAVADIPELHQRAHEGSKPHS
jgi:hypothetical protein